jgi:hypothetical protein
LVFRAKEVVMRPNRLKTNQHGHRYDFRTVPPCRGLDVVGACRIVMPRPDLVAPMTENTFVKQNDTSSVRREMITPLRRVVTARSGFGMLPSYVGSRHNARSGRREADE